MEFKQRIKKLRKERKFTQQHLANLLNMDKSSISKYETGVALPEPPIIEKLSDIFNVSVDYLLGRTNNRKSSLIKGYYKNNKVEIEINERKVNLTQKEIQDLIDKLGEVGFDVNKLLSK